MNLYKYYKYTRFFIYKRTYYKAASISHIDYCAKIVRQHDYENFLATLLISKEIRTPALILRAFNVEIARIQDNTTDAQTAAFRLQFWKDVLVSIFKSNETTSIPANPIAQELYKVCTKYNLSKRHLDKLINSRNLFLKSKHFNSLENVEQYTEDTVSTIYYLILSVAGVANVHADHAASHLGKAQGITNILRSIHVSNHHKTVSLPMELLMKHKVSQEAVLRGKDDENIRNVAFDIASRANSHLQKARSLKVPNLCKEIFLPAVAVDQYLSKLQKCHFNIFDNTLQRGNATLPFTLYYKKFFKIF